MRGSNPCTLSEQQLIITPPLPEIGGTIDDPNHLRGTTSEIKPAGYRGTGTVTSTLAWDLAREGSAR